MRLWLCVGICSWFFMFSCQVIIRLISQSFKLFPAINVLCHSNSNLLTCKIQLSIAYEKKIHHRKTLKPWAISSNLDFPVIGSALITSYSSKLYWLVLEGKTHCHFIFICSQLHYPSHTSYTLHVLNLSFKSGSRWRQPRWRDTPRRLRRLRLPTAATAAAADFTTWLPATSSRAPSTNSEIHTLLKSI